MDSPDSRSDRNCNKPAASKCEKTASGATDDTRCEEKDIKKTQLNKMGRDTVREGSGGVSCDGEARIRVESRQLTGDKFSKLALAARNRFVVFRNQLVLISP